MDFGLTKKHYNKCNPFNPLGPDDPLNVDLDAFGPGGRMVRGVNWVGKFVKEIALSDEPVIKLFSGVPGSGKTTELLRLKKRLADPYEGNLFTVMIDAEETLDLLSPPHIVDILLSVVFHVEKAVAEKKNGEAMDALENGFMRRFWNFLEETDAAFGRGELSVPQLGRLVYEMKNRGRLRERAREAAALDFSRFASEAAEELEHLKEAVIREFNRNGIAVIFDSLEKISAISSELDAAMDSAELVFKELAIVKLPVKAVYTVPAALAPRVRGVDFLPLIQVRDRNGDSDEKGINAGREIIKRRLPQNAIKEIFGPDCDERIDRMILQSGGNPRDLLQLLQKAVAHEGYPVTDTDLEKFYAEIAGDYRIAVPKENYDWLVNVWKDKFLVIENDRDRKIAGQMLADGAVLRYFDLDLWFDLHPAVCEIPEIGKGMGEIV